MKKKNYKIFSIIILFIMFLFLCYQAPRKSFWYDELDWTIEILANSSIFTMMSSLLNSIFNLPLYYLFLYPFYRILPYGEIWLLLPNFVVTIIGVYIMKKIGDKIECTENNSDGCFGFLCLLVAASSYYLIWQGALELRPYALLFCCSSWTFYKFLSMLEERNKKNIILYTLSMILLSYTHWFGCLIIVYYFLVECLLWQQKKIPLSFLFPYIIVGVSFLPWFILILFNIKNIAVYNWATSPKFKDLFKIIQKILGSEYIFEVLFVSGFIIFIVYLFIKRKRYKHLKISFSCILFMIGTVFIYSKYINQKYSLFISRYFVVILPHVFIFIALSIYEILYWFNITKFMEKLSKMTVAIIIINMFYQNYDTVNDVRIKDYQKPYREMVDYVVSEKLIYKKNTALITSTGKGYLAYYFEKKGIPLPKNAFVGSFDDNKSIQIVEDGIRKEKKVAREILLNYDILYLFRDYGISKKYDYDKKLIKFINDNYEVVEKDEKLDLTIVRRKK